MNGCENSDQSGSQMKKHNFTKIWGPMRARDVAIEGL